ncbi:MAG: MBL fold metallo-hydrolase [Tannerella sp.]|jgi:glyoxylase-like metal-dependent hydrolase (beta-lactamase superfamily II)|nr:MBL fold metallo-hydrolase [Tannerella sp.]
MFKLINTGNFYADGGAMFGAIPKVTWNRSYPANDRNLCVLTMHAGVVRTKDHRVIVIDPGVGKDQLEKSPAVYYQFHDTRDIIEELLLLGISSEDVTDVVFTHLHFDHCGAAVKINLDGIAEPVFKNANHWLSRAQYENEKHPHPLEKDSFLPENTAVLEKAGLLKIVESTIQPFESLRIELFDGHTLGQIAATVKPENENMNVLFPGDILPLASHVVPERISAYDLYPTLSYFGKINLLEKAVKENQWVVFYHDAYMPCSHIRQVGKTYKSYEQL